MLKENAEQLASLQALIKKYKQENIPLLVQHYKALLYAFIGILQYDCTPKAIASSKLLEHRYDALIKEYKTKNPL